MHSLFAQLALAEIPAVGAGDAEVGEVENAQVHGSDGDILLFRMREGAVAKHLGFAATGAAGPTVIHAYTGHGVVESPLSAAWSRRIVARFRFPFEG